MGPGGRLGGASGANAPGKANGTVTTAFAGRPTAADRDGQRIRVHGTDGYVEILS
jgi:hypothetical protein